MRDLGQSVKLILIVLPILAAIGSLFLGAYSASPATVCKLLISQLPFVDLGPFPGCLETAILSVRLPRVLLAVMVGMSLSIAGASFQGLFRNPLVSSHILGVAPGAAFGAALAIILDAPPFLIQVSAFVSGLGAVGLTYVLSRLYHTTPKLTMVLAGVIVGAFFSSAISFIKYIADPMNKMPEIVFWLMGSLASTSTKDVWFALVPMALGVGTLLLIRWRINVLSMGEEEAQALGIDTVKLRAVVVFCGTLLTAASVCVSGMVGWIGLVIPHIGRMIVGPDHKVLLPACLSIGGAYLLLVDDLARTLTAGEIPLGILTGIIGTPFFAYLLRKGMKWQ
jgi:iron complex transport system permease protein